MFLRRAAAHWLRSSRGVTAAAWQGERSPPACGPLAHTSSVATTDHQKQAIAQPAQGRWKGCRGVCTGWTALGCAVNSKHTASELHTCQSWSWGLSGRQGVNGGHSGMQARGYSSSDAGSDRKESPHQLVWPLAEEQMEGLDAELKEAMELDIFAQRDMLPEAVAQMLADGNPEDEVTAEDGTLKITRISLESLQARHLQELLMRVGEDTRGSKMELVDRLFTLLEELWEVQNEVGGRPSWTVIDEEMDAQRQFARVFQPDEVSEILVKARTQDVVILDLRHVGEMRFTDYFVLATARSDRHMMASAGAVVHALKQRCCEVIPGKAPLIEGDVGSKWICVDAGSIVVHVFLEDSRQRVDLESLWVGLGASLESVAQPETIHTAQTMRVDEGSSGE